MSILRCVVLYMNFIIVRSTHRWSGNFDSVHTTRLQQSQCSFPFASGFAGWNGTVVTDKIRLRLKNQRIRWSSFRVRQASRISQVPKLMGSSIKHMRLRWHYANTIRVEKGEEKECGYTFPRRTHREVDVAHPKMVGQAQAVSCSLRRSF